MVGPATTPISIDNISIVVAGPQVVTIITKCCSRLEEVNAVVFLSHLLNILIYVCVTSEMIEAPMNRKTDTFKL